MANSQEKQAEEKAQVQSKRSLLMIFFALLLIAGASAAYVQITDDNNLPIRKINISGSFKNVDPAALNKIVNSDVKGNFFTLDVTRLYERLEAQEWVQQVWIHRVWPDKLHIELTEQVPVAFVPSQGLLNAEGQIFTSNYAAYKNHLPEFNVAARYYKQAIDAYWSLKNTIADFKFGIKQFTFDGRKSQMIQLDNGVDIVLGRYEPEKRFNRFIRVFGREVEQNRRAIKRVDLRFTNGFAVSAIDAISKLSMKKVLWS